MEKKVTKDTAKYAHGYRQLTNFPDDFTPEFEDDAEKSFFVRKRNNLKRKNADCRLILKPNSKNEMNI
jgi:hypothetical protein